VVYENIDNIIGCEKAPVDLTYKTSGYTVDIAPHPYSAFESMSANWPDDRLPSKEKHRLVVDEFAAQRVL